MRMALLCDVDQRIYHVGDEAIATATTSALEGDDGDRRSVTVLFDRTDPQGRAART